MGYKSTKTITRSEALSMLPYSYLNSPNEVLEAALEELTENYWHNFIIKD